MIRKTIFSILAFIAKNCPTYNNAQLPNVFLMGATLCHYYRLDIPIQALSVQGIVQWRIRCAHTFIRTSYISRKSADSFPKPKYYTGFVDPSIVNINKVFKESTEILQEMIGHKVIESIFTKLNSVQKMPTFAEVKIDYFSGESQHKSWKFDTQCITLKHCTIVEATFYELATLTLLCLENMYACKTV